MPEKTCGRKYCSPRLKLGEDSLAPGKSRTGNLQLPLQIIPRNIFEMLVHGSSEEAQRAGGGIQAEWEFFSSSCLVFQYGVRDFRREPGAWNMGVGFISDVQLAGSVTFAV